MQVLALRELEFIGVTQLPVVEPVEATGTYPSTGLGFVTPNLIRSTAWDVIPAISKRESKPWIPDNRA